MYSRVIRVHKLHTFNHILCSQSNSTIFYYLHNYWLIDWVIGWLHTDMKILWLCIGSSSNGLQMWESLTQSASTLISHSYTHSHNWPGQTEYFDDILIHRRREENKFADKRHLGLPNKSYVQYHLSVKITSKIGQLVDQSKYMYSTYNSSDQWSVTQVSLTSKTCVIDNLY